ncbi:hypothetical protein [Promicromonospora sp. NPDC023805]|uniref:hypothetical protein n=1 Tax=Promicromonospora sp. NPDC023805 TaxID=3154696 RepID=UPI00340AF36F
MSALERRDVVRVVAEKLPNGAPHPLLGETGVVLTTAGPGIFPVHVRVDGHPGGAVTFSPDELARVEVPA